jgi:hypothetical protein
VLWLARDDLEELHGDVLGIWRGWGDDVSGRSLDCGHHMAEESPDKIRADIYDDATTQALLAASIDAWCAEAAGGQAA